MKILEKGMEIAKRMNYHSEAAAKDYRQLDVQLAKKKMKLGELADIIGITNANLSILKTTKPRPSVSPLQRHLPSPSTASRGHSEHVEEESEEQKTSQLNQASWDVYSVAL